MERCFVVLKGFLYLYSPLFTHTNSPFLYIYTHTFTQNENKVRMRIRMKYIDIQSFHITSDEEYKCYRNETYNNHTLK